MSRANALIAWGSLAGFVGAQEAPEPDLRPRVTGRAVDTHGSPLAGIGCVLGKATDLRTLHALEQPNLVTDADGRFTLFLFTQRDHPDAAEADHPFAEVGSEHDTALFAGHRSAALALRLSNFGAKRKPPAPEIQPVHDPRIGPWSLSKAVRKAARVADATHDLGDLVFDPGMTLTGRVLDAETGDALLYAQIHAVDLLASSMVFRPHPRPHGQLEAIAETDGNGLFQLPGVPRECAGLRFYADGYYDGAIASVDPTTPLVIELEPSGHITGRCLDAQGRGLYQRKVALRYEVANHYETVHTDRDGSFQFSLRYRGRYRIYGPGTNTELRAGPSSMLELVQPAPDQPKVASPAARDADAADADSDRIAIGPAIPNQSFDQGPGEEESAPELDPPVLMVEVLHNGQPFAGKVFAVMVWGTELDQTWRRWTQAVSRRNNPLTGEAGTLRIPRPADNTNRMGWALVWAEGLAPTFTEAIEWSVTDDERAAKGFPPRTVRIELDAAASIRGRLVHERTGTPVGATVSVREARNTQNKRGRFGWSSSLSWDQCETDEHGEFTLVGLPDGLLRLVATHVSSGATVDQSVKLAPGDELRNVRMTLPRLATVHGEVRNLTSRIELAPGVHTAMHWQHRIVSMPTIGTHKLAQSTRVWRPDLTNVRPLPLSGRFCWNSEFPGPVLMELVAVRNNRFRSIYRTGVGALRATHEPGSPEVIDARSSMPGVVAGQVAFTHQGLPFGRLGVFAERQFMTGRAQGRSSFIDSEGATSVRPNGAFEILVPGGRYRFVLMDMLTGLRLWESEDGIRIDGAERITIQVRPELTSLRIHLEDEDPQRPWIADRLELRFLQSGSAVYYEPRYSSRKGVSLAHRPKFVDLVLPAGTLTMLARSGAHAISIGSAWDGSHLGEATLIVTAGERMEHRLKIDPPTSPQ